MSVLNFQPGSRKSRIPGNQRRKFRLIFLLAITGVTALIGSTFAFNPTISVNGNQPIEFGQGIQFLTTCSGEEKIYVTAGSEFQADENKFLLTDLAFSHVPDSCLGKQFLVSAYNASEQLNLDTDINIARVLYLGDATTAIFAGESGTTPISATITNPGASDGFGTFTIHFTGDRPESHEVKTLTVLSRNGLGGNGSSNNPGLSAYQIHRDWPNLPSGLYWVRNPNINNGVAIQIYADMSRDGGGWTLILANAQNVWTRNETLETNIGNPPQDPAKLASQNGKYSILKWADSIRKSPSDFQYRIEANNYGQYGGIWSVLGPSSFTSTATNSNITLDAQWFAQYNDLGIQNSMPHLLPITGGECSYQILTTSTHVCGEYWWGTLVKGSGDFNGNFGTGPWIESQLLSPDILWYWVR